jgi:carbamoylphosphate synthase small subunit
LALTTGDIDPQFVMTDPSFRGMFVLSDLSEIGPLGVRPGVDQSDSLQASGLFCRDLVDFPSFRGSFKSISLMMARGGSASITSMDMGHLLGYDGQDAAALVIQAERLDLSMIGTMERALGSFSYERDQSSLWTGKRIDYPNNEVGRKILVLDLGMRGGILRALRRAGNVTTVPPSVDLSEVFNGDPDLSMISSGPGMTPSGELVAIVKGFLEMFDGIPVYSMGIGALAMNVAMGGIPGMLEKAHRGTSIEVKIGGTLLPTYQNHELALGLVKGFKARSFGPDGSPEVLISKKGAKWVMSTMDTLPEFGMVRGDPFFEFIGGGGR